MDGILIVDKPQNFTSHDIVARLRRILKTKRIGHTGTLDPFATGVLVMLVGKATRLAHFLDKDAKEYHATIRFGFETDTGDRTGRQKAEGKRQKFSAEELEDVLKDFRGEIWQTPPMYSAKKLAGKKLYELARKGIEVERQPVQITIHALEIVKPPELQKSPSVETQIIDEKAEAFPLEAEALNLKMETFPLEAEALNLKVESLNFKAEDLHLQAEDLPLKAEDLHLKAEDLDFEGKILDFRAEIRVVCSAGTYIRTLAEDIGRKLGTGAHLAELRRTRAGQFELSKAVTLEELEKIAAENELEKIFVSMNEAVAHLPQVLINETEIADTRNGKKLRFESNEIADNQLIRMIDAAENLIAVGRYSSGEKFVQPKLVLV